MPDMYAVEGWLSNNEIDALMKYARLTTGTIVEVGAYRGRSTIPLATVAKEQSRRFYSIDPHYTHEAGGHQFGMADAAALMRNLLNFDLAEHVRIVNLPSTAALFALLTLYGSQYIGFAFIDGDHAYEICRSDFEMVADAGRWDVLITVHDSTGAWDGPTRVVNEAVASGEWVIIEQLDNLTILQRANIRD
jgi:predicted O-methyltransferase YrrM